MALGSGGLDAQIEQRMDAYRSNPQQLQQRYGANKELLDLLALQKLTSEKQAAARDMQMKMQQQPGTIAQQREQEALELTKQQMGGTLGQLAQNTKSTLDQKQAMQQQNMQRMAQGAARPQMGQGAGLAGLMGGAQPRPQARPAPQAQGLAAARMAQGPSKFAGGGIVSFAGGEEVSGSPFTRYVSGAIRGLKDDMSQAQLRQRVQTMYGPYAAPIGGLFHQSDTNRARAKGIIDRLQANELTTAEMQALVEQYPEFRQQAARVETAPTDTGTPLQVPQEGIGGLLPPSPLATTGGPAVQPPTPTPTPTTVPDAVEPAAAEAAEAAVPTPEQTAASFSVPQTADAANTGVMPAQGTTSADSAFLRGTQMADEYTGRDAANQSYEDMKAKLSEFDKENYGPRDDLNSFLIGMGGTGSIGAAMKGGYSSMLRSKNNRRNRMMDEFQLEKDRIGTDAVFSTAGIKLGTQLAADAAANERSIRSAAATLGAAKIREAIANADRLVDVYKADLQAIDNAAGREVQMIQNTRIAEQTRLNAAIKVQSDVAATRSAMVEDQLSSSPVLMRLSTQKAKALQDNDTEALSAINQNIAAETAQIALTVESVLNTPTPSGLNLLELETIANETIRSLMGTKLTEDDVDKVTSEGE